MLSVSDIVILAAVSSLERSARLLAPSAACGARGRRRVVAAACVCVLRAAQADVCQLGVDQRKVNMLAREYCDACGKKTREPVLLSDSRSGGGYTTWSGEETRDEIRMRHTVRSTPGKKLKPVILSHHMLYGLKPGQEKMSKSDPDSAIFMEVPRTPPRPSTLLRSRRILNDRRLLSVDRAIPFG